MLIYGLTCAEGPPFTHPATPYAAHFIGGTSPKQSPSHYLHSIQALVQTYKVDLQFSSLEYEHPSQDERIADTIPLVVNTMGWAKGLGADFARRIEETAETTHVFSMGQPAKSGEWSFGEGRLEQAHVVKLEVIPPKSQSQRFSASDWRAISTLSYFHSVPSIASGSHRTWDCNLPLLAHPPYTLSPSKALDSVVLAGAGTEDVIPSEIGRVLNGAIVALVTAESDSSDRSPSAIPYVQGSAPPDPFSSNCIGLALVRGVSPSAILNGAPSDDSAGDAVTLQLLTPVPASILLSAQPRHLVKGEIELPVWGFLDFRDTSQASAESYPFLEWRKGEGQGAERRRVRRNLMRRSQQ